MNTGNVRLQLELLISGSFLLCRTHRDLAGSLYTQVLQSLQKVLGDPVRPLCSHYGAVVGLHALGWKVTCEKKAKEQRIL